MAVNKGKIKTIVAMAIAILAAAFLAKVIFVPNPVKVEVAEVTVGRFRETIRADGILRSKERYTVPAFADGDIKRVSLKVGDEVKKGQEITRLFWDVKYDPLKSPIQGVISKVYRESAGPIRRGEPVVEIVDPSRLEVMAEMLTTDAVRLKVGSEATIENWNGKTSVKAKITQISKAGFTKQSALGVEEERTEVTADLVDPPQELLERAGNTFHVDLVFLVSETPNATKIPVGALFRDGQNWAVYVAEDGRARKRNIEIGANGPQEASVKSGLHSGETVIVYPGDLVKDSSRIAFEKPARKTPPVGDGK